MELSDQIEEEEEEELNENKETIEKVNIINKLVCSNEWIDDIYYKSMKKLINNVKSILSTEDVIRTKSVSMPKSIYFYLLIIVVLYMIGCSCYLIYSTVTLDLNSKFIEYGKENHDNITDNTNIDYSNDTVIIPCHSCYVKIAKGNAMGMVSGCYSLIFVIFVFAILSSQVNKCNKKERKRKKAKLKKIYVDLT